MSYNLHSVQANDRIVFCRKNKKLRNLTTKQSDKKYINDMNTRKFLFFLLCGMLLPMMTSAQSYARIDGIYYKLNTTAQTAEVYSSRFRYTGDVVIPSSVTHEGVEYSVTGIGNRAFYASADLTSVSIPNSVTSIGTGIFEGCTSLASIVVEDGNAVYDSRENCNAVIETAGNKLLNGCNGTVIPNSVTSIEELSFVGSGLTTIIIPNGVTSIGRKAFFECSGLTSVTIGSGVPSIGEQAFGYCGSLKKVELNNNAIVSKKYAWETNSSIKDIFGNKVEEYVLGEDVTAIGDAAFNDCNQLISVYMTDNVTSIGEYAFYRCEKLSSCRMSANVTSIGDFAFYWCLGLTSITIPSGLTDIEKSTFYGHIKRVEINSNSIVSRDYDWNSLAYYFGPEVEEFVLGEEITSIGKNAFKSSSVISINIPSNVTSIGETAFIGCYRLSSIHIPANVSSIGANAFYDCPSLTSIQVENGNTAYDSRENCNAIIETATNTILWGCQNTVIPNTVTAIGDNAFYMCSGLTSIDIPNSVTAIGENAFAGCNGLTVANIPNSVTIIGKYAFSHCTQLTGITIPNTVITIDEGAFFFCSGLTSVTIPNNVTTIAYRAFTGCSGLTSIQVESENAVYDSRENCNAIIETADNTIILGCQNTVIPNSVTSIGDEAFWACTSLTSISIPNSVTSIGNGAFNQCINLTSICIPNGVTSIGKVAFVECSKLATVIIPNTITTIGNYAFIRSGLTDMYCYAEQLPEIGSEIFQDTYRKVTLHVPASSLDAYSNAEQWKEFPNIVALTDSDPKPTGIIAPAAMQQPTIVECYDLSGCRISQLQRGVNIIKMSDGTTKKVVVK